MSELLDDPGDKTRVQLKRLAKPAVRVGERLRHAPFSILHEGALGNAAYTAMNFTIGAVARRTASARAAVMARRPGHTTKRVGLTESTSVRTTKVPFASAADRFVLGLPFLLSVIAGSLDVIGFLGLNGLFVAHITGNLAVLAARIIAGDLAILSHILSVPMFVSVLLLASLMARIIERAGGSSLKPLLLHQLLFLLACLLLSITTGPWREADAPLGIMAAMCGVGAMAVQNALVRISLRNTPATAVMTTNVTHLVVELSTVLVCSYGEEIADAKTRALRILPVIIGFLLGCALGAALEATVGLYALVLPTALALFAVCRQEPPGQDGQPLLRDAAAYGSQPTAPFHAGPDVPSSASA